VFELHKLQRADTTNSTLGFGCRLLTSCFDSSICFW